MLYIRFVFVPLLRRVNEIGAESDFPLTTLAEKDGITNEAYIIKVYAHLMFAGKYCHKQFQRINTNVIHFDGTRTPLLYCIFVRLEERREEKKHENGDH